MRYGAVLLAGGRSSRMGEPNAALEWHGTTLIDRVARILSRGVEGGPVVVVRAPGQVLPSLPANVTVVDDAREGRGPLQGMLAGLEAIAPDADVAYISAVDVPMLHPTFIRHVVTAVSDHVDVALPVALGHRHPLAAAYRTALVGTIAALVSDDRMKPAFLFDVCRLRILDERELREDAALALDDPELASLANLNERVDYELARARPAPAISIERFGTLRPDGVRGAVAGHAATLGAAAAAVDLALDGHIVAAVNGDQISADPLYALATGDAVAFLAADGGG